MPDSNNQFFLVNLSISIECFDKSLLGLYCTSSSTEAKILAIQGECHNIDHEDDEDVQHWYEKISDSVKNDHSVEDDDFCYSITSCRALTITEAMIDNQKVMLAVLPPLDDGDDEEYSSESVNTGAPNETPYLTKVEWKTGGYEKHLNPIVWASDANAAMKKAVLIESEDLPDEDEEDYAAIHSNLVKRIEESDDISNNEYSGSYRAEWAKPLKSVVFMLDDKSYSGLIDPTQERQPLLVYMATAQ